MLNMRNYLGEVKINNSLPELELKVSREGFLDSPAFQELKQFVKIWN